MIDSVSEEDPIPEGIVDKYSIHGMQFISRGKYDFSNNGHSFNFIQFAKQGENPLWMAVDEVDDDVVLLYIHGKEELEQVLNFLQMTRAQK